MAIYTSQKFPKYAGIRVYRNASFTVPSSFGQLSFDAESSLLVSENLTLSGGDIVCGVKGEIGCGVFITQDPALMVTGIRIQIIKNPATDNITLCDLDYVGNANTKHCHHADAVCDVDVDDVIRVMIQTNGSGTADGVPGDGITWAYAVITPR